MPTLGDNTFADGKLGFWTKSDAVSYFTDATVDYTPIVPAAQALVNTIMEQQPRILGLQIYTLGTNDDDPAFSRAKNRGKSASPARRRNWRPSATARSPLGANPARCW